MEQNLKTVNGWILSYIRQYRQSKSRYEIDSYLLEIGYDATEIETAWHLIEENKANYFIDRRMPGWDNRDKRETSRLIGILSGILGILAGIYVLMGIFETGYDPDTGRVVISERMPLVTWGGCLIIILGIVEMVSGWFAPRNAKRSGIAQLTLTGLHVFVALFFFASYYLLVAPLALLYGLSGAIALSSDTKESNWTQKTGLLVLVSFLGLVIVPIGLMTLVRLLLF